MACPPAPSSHLSIMLVQAPGHYLLSRVWALAGEGRNGHGGIVGVWSGATTIQVRRLHVQNAVESHGPP